MTAAEPWYTRAFAGDYLRRYAHRSPAQAEAEAPFIVHALGLPAGARVLDLCCGAGRHCGALARLGLRSAGLDLSADLTREARAAHPALPFLRGDMRRLPFADSAFAGAVSLFTSFGYFEREEEDLAVLREVARVLRPGGVLLLDFFNLAPTLACLRGCTERTAGTARIVETRSYDAAHGRLEKRIRVEQDGAPPREVLESVRAYTPAELELLLGRAGMKVRARYGDLQGAPFAAESSPRCVLLGCKEARP